MHPPLPYSPTVRLSLHLPNPDYSIMADLIIPPNVNTFTLEGHAVILAWVGKCSPSTPGTPIVSIQDGQPRWTLEHRLAATKTEILAHFRVHPTDNVGLVPEAPNVGVDVDDPDPRASGVRAIRQRWPELFSHPYVRARRGPHFHAICSGAPSDLAKRVVGNFKGLGVTVEGYFGPAMNIILPPSIHHSSTPGNLVRYLLGLEVWGALAPTYLEFNAIFGFNGQGAPSTSQAPKTGTGSGHLAGINFACLDLVKVMGASWTLWPAAG